MRGSAALCGLLVVAGCSFDGHGTPVAGDDGPRPTADAFVPGTDARMIDGPPAGDIDGPPTQDIDGTPPAACNPGRHYVFVDAATTWFDAEEACESRDMHLAIINNEAEHDHVVNILNLQSPGNEQIWLGFSDLACGNNEFISVTGAAVTIPDISDEGWGWDNGEPSNGGKKSNTDDGAENCVVLRENGPTAGGWNDAPCVAEKHTFFCECDGDRPDPRFFSAPDKGGVCPLD